MSYGLVVCFALLLGTRTVQAQTEERDRVDLYVQAVEPGRTRVAVRGSATALAGADIEEAAGRALGARIQFAQRNEVAGYDQWTLQDRDADIARHHGLTAEIVVDPKPLLDSLRAVDVPWLTISLSHPGLPVSRCSGAYRVPDKYVRYFAAFPLSDRSAAPIRLVYGYRTADALAWVAPILGLFVATIGLTLWMRRIALRAGSADRTGVWFAYIRALQWIVNGGWLVWLGVSMGLGMDELPRFVLGPRSEQASIAISMLVYFVPGALSAILCTALSHPVYARVRGMEWTRSDLIRQSTLGIVSRILPLLLLFVGVGALLDRQPPRAIVWALAAYLVFVFGMRSLVRATGFIPQALTVGELRDRIFALAEKAGVKLRQIYYVPAGKGRMANAFAAQGNNILLTDYLLQSLDRREVDAIVAHELTHLKHNHPRKLSRAYAMPIAIGIAFGIAVGSVEGLHRWIPLVPVALFLGLMLGYLVSRRFERVADAGAVALTGDPEAMITGLAKVMRLNQLPMQWNRWHEGLITHPSTLRRVEAIARDGHMPADRVQAILADAGETDSDRYPLPTAGPQDGRVFSTTFKANRSFNVGWALAGVTVLTPAVAAWIIEAAHLEGTARWLGFAAGLAASVAANLAASNRLAVSGYATLERRLRERFAREGLPIDDATFVGFAPDSAPRVYEGYYDWDLGLLFVRREGLSYVGEEARFTLRPEQIVSIRLGPGAPSWWSAPRIYISWRDPESGHGGIFNLRAASERTLSQCAAATRALAASLESWRRAPTAGPPLPAPLRAPQIGQVTSLTTRAVANARTFLRYAFTLLLLALGAAILLQLPFDRPQSGGWFALAAALLVGLAQWLPSLRAKAE